VQELTSKREQFYKRRIAELEAQLKLRDERIGTLEKQVAELLKANEAIVRENAELSEQIAKLSRNSSNSSKPPSSDIVKPPSPKQSDEARCQGGQPGHKGINRQPFGRALPPISLRAGCTTALECARWRPRGHCLRTGQSHWQPRLVRSSRVKSHSNRTRYHSPPLRAMEIPQDMGLASSASVKASGR